MVMRLQQGIEGWVEDRVLKGKCRVSGCEKAWRKEKCMSRQSQVGLPTEEVCTNILSGIPAVGLMWLHWRHIV
jgi:hypothetical protein